MPLPSAAAPAYTEVTRAIELLQNRQRKATVQELKKTLLYYLVIESGNALEINGENVEIPFYLSPPALSRWVDKGDALPDGGSVKMAMGYATNSYLVTPVGWDQLEQWIIEGSPQKVFDMIDLKSAEHAWAKRRALTAAAWNGGGGKEPTGVSTFIEAAAPTAQSQVYMGVDKAAKPWFRNQAVQLTTNFGYIASGTSIPAGFLALMNLINACTVGSARPSHIITTKAIFDVIRRAFLEVSSPQHMITERKVAMWGFEMFNFHGVWIGWDPDCPADKLYALHINHNFDVEVTNGAPDKASLDRDLEDVGTSSLFELNGSFGFSYHPNIRNRQIQARSPYRRLTQVQWTMDSFGTFSTRLSDHGVAYSDSGSRWSTW